MRFTSAAIAFALSLTGAGVQALAPPRAVARRAVRPALRRSAPPRVSAARMMPLPITYPARGFTSTEAAAPAEVSTLIGTENAPKFITIGANEPIGIVANALSNAGRSASAIIEDDGMVIGIFTERDYLNALNCAADSTDEECIIPTDEQTLQTVELIASPVRDFITPVERLVTVPPDCTIVSALRLMGARGIRHLPVIKAGASVAQGLRTDAVLGVLSVGTLAEWVQRDSETLQTKYSDRLSELNPRFAAFAGRSTGGKGSQGLLLAIGLLFASAVTLFTEQTWISGHWQLVMVGSFILG